jgi:hypothetical protein
MSRRTDGQYEIRSSNRIRTAADAVRFIETVGFCALFPVKNVALPSLYFAVAKRAPTTWDKYAQLIWKWKDELPRKRRAFYGKYFKGRGSFLALSFLPYFLALDGTAVAAGEAEEFYRAGHIRHDAMELWQALAKLGPLATL